MYYLLICVSVVMFGGCFALNDVYRKLRGDSFKTSMQFTFTGSLAALIVLFAVNGFYLEFTPFALIMALLTAVNGFAFTYCSFRALGCVNLSVYSLFSMLGGMVLPFVEGIVFYGESLTVAKGVCLVMICAALALTVKKGEGGGQMKFCVAVFLLNGMSGVLSKIFAASPFEKTSAAGFTMLIAVCSFAIASVALLFLRGAKEERPPSVRSAVVSALHGSVSKIANFILVLALAHVDASVQYPMVTGGVMIVSTLLCFFGKDRPKKRELLSVLIAFAALLALFLIPV